MIHVAYKLYGGDTYHAKYCGTSMLSMFENTKQKVTVHLMHSDRLTSHNRDAFCYIAGQYNQLIEFHNVHQIASETLKKFEERCPPGNRWSPAIYYTFVCHEIFPNLDKLIVIGADTIINLDIAELWAYDLGEYGFGALPESFLRPVSQLNGFPICNDGYVKRENYLNDDILLLKPKFFLQNLEKLLDGLKFMYEKKYPYISQDLLSYLFSENYLKLPRKFNDIVMFLRVRPPCIVGKEIYHFAGNGFHKPSINTDDVYNKLYCEYFLKTPWANVDIFGNMDKAFSRQYDKVKAELLRYVNLLGSRGRIFLLDKNIQEKMRQIFEIRAFELVIDASDADSRKKFLETANELKGKSLIFIISSDMLAIRNELCKINLIEGQDFCNANMFLTPREGGNILFYDSNAILTAM